MTRKEAIQYRDYYAKLIPKLMEAKLELLDGRVKSYTIGDRSLTRYDLAEISAELDKAQKTKDELDAFLNGQKRRKAVGVIPRDF